MRPPPLDSGSRSNAALLAIGIAVATVALLSVVSAAAGFIPARRASRIDPILALRYE